MYLTLKLERYCLHNSSQLKSFNVNGLHDTSELEISRSIVHLETAILYRWIIIKMYRFLKLESYCFYNSFQLKSFNVNENT